MTPASDSLSNPEAGSDNQERERLTHDPPETLEGTTTSLDSSSHSASSEQVSETPPTSRRPKDESDAAEQRTRRRTVVLFSLTTVLLFADQNLLSPNLTAAATEFGFSDEERDRKLGGDIALAFFLLGAPASFLIGCLADQTDRSFLFAWTVGIGEGACMATFWTRTYPQLYVCRAITGFSIGGAIPLIYSVLGDLFVAEDRHAVSALIGIGTGAGIALGQGIAGFLGPTYGWRAPFLVVSIPALVCALLVLVTVPDPERGSMEKVVIDMRQHHLVESDDTEHHNGDGIEMEGLAPVDVEGVLVHSRVSRRKTGQSCSIQTAHALEGTDGAVQDQSVAQQNSWTCLTCGQDWRSHLSTLKSLLSCPTVILTFIQGAPGCLPWGIVNSFLNDFLSEDRGMTVEGATATVLCFGLGNFFGLLVGGAGGRYLYVLDPRYPALLAGSAAILGCIPFWLLLNTIDKTSPFLYIGVVTLLGGLGTGVTGPIVKATLQNVTLPNTRGQAFAMYNLFDDFGRGLGPVFVSLLIVNMGGRTPAFNVGVLGWIVCGLFNLLIYFTVTVDERKAQATLAASLHYAPFTSTDDNASSLNENMIDEAKAHEVV